MYKICQYTDTSFKDPVENKEEKTQQILHLLDFSLKGRQVSRG